MTSAVLWPAPTSVPANTLGPGSPAGPSAAATGSGWRVTGTNAPVRSASSSCSGASPGAPAAHTTPRT